MNRSILRRNWRLCRNLFQTRFYVENIPIPIVENTTPIIKEEPKQKSDKEDSKKSKTFKEYLMYLKFIKHAATTLALVTVTYAIFLESTSTKRSVHALQSTSDPTLQCWESKDTVLFSSDEFKIFEQDFQARHQYLASLLSSQTNHVIILSGKYSIGKSVSIRHLARQLQSKQPTHIVELKTKTPIELAQEISELLDYNQDYITNTLQSFNFIRNPTTDLRMVIQHLEKACLVLQQQQKKPPVLVIDQINAYSNPENLDFLIDLAKDFSSRNLATFVFVTNDNYLLQQKYPKWSQQVLCFEIQQYSSQSVANYLEYKLQTSIWTTLLQQHAGCNFQLLQNAVSTLLSQQSEWKSPEFVRLLLWNVLQQRKVKQFLTSENGLINYLSQIESNSVIQLLNTISKDKVVDLLQCCELLNQQIKDYRRSLQIIRALIEQQILYCNSQTLQISLNL